MIKSAATTGPIQCNWLVSVSCATSTFCIAVNQGGFESTFSDGTWSAGHQIDNGNNDAGLKSVSCATANFCVAVDSGNEFTYSDGTWSAGQQINTNGIFDYALASCPTANFCVATFGGYEYTYR